MAPNFRRTLLLALVAFAVISLHYLQSQSHSHPAHLHPESYGDASGTDDHDVEQPIVRELTDAPAAPELVNVPPPGKVKKAIVVPKIRGEDVNWLRSLMPEWTPYIYSASDPPEKDYPLVPHSTRGREGITYLSFIIDHYESLPAITAFVHASDRQRHNVDLGRDTSGYLRALRSKTVLKRGYANLRCSHEAGCPSSVNPHNPTEIDIKNDDVRAHFVEVYMELFGVKTPAEVPKVIGGACCAMFAVSRERILEKPLSYYKNMADWIVNRSQKDLNSYETGWVFEKIWHVVFGMSAVDCPSERQCKCDLYGWCGPFADDEEISVFGEAKKAS